MTKDVSGLLGKHVSGETVCRIGGVVATWLRKCRFAAVGSINERAEEARRKAGQHRVAMGILRKTYSPRLI